MEFNLKRDKIRLQKEAGDLLNQHVFFFEKAKTLQSQLEALDTAERLKKIKDYSESLIKKE